MTAMTMQAALARLPNASDPAVEPTLILWVGVGWLFAFEFRRYMETRSFMDRAVGGYSLVLDTGEIVGFSGARHWQTSVVEWARSAGVSDRLEPWVVEQREIFERPTEQREDG